ncbi:MULTISPECIES: hypothetical protein [unclassified Paenibacillus]|uniref:hypothetical protein n=1 Tax=unclassified Paenibacillus TaxID=185978 RepID=UPI0036345177
MAKLANKHGKAKIVILSLFFTLIGAWLSLNSNQWLKLLGLPIVSFGFFGCHSLASGWVNQCGRHDKAQASSLYLFFYYAGSSIGGTTAGGFWSSYGCGGVVGMIAGFLLSALVLSSMLAKSVFAVPKHDET